MIVLLVIAAAWLGLLLLVVGMLHFATGTPTPRPAGRTDLSLIGDAWITAAESRAPAEAPRRVWRAPTQAA